MSNDQVACRTPSAGHAALWRPLRWLALLVVLATGARLARLGYLPWPACWLRQLTGLPCPSCGVTRSLVAWTHLDLMAACRYNPLFFLACLTLLAWLAAAFADLVFGWRLIDRLSRALDRWPGGWWLVLVVLDWLYLCFALPK